MGHARGVVVAVAVLGSSGAVPTELSVGGGIPPPLSQDLTGCWEMGASNGRPPRAGCGTAPLDDGDGLVWLSQKLPGGEIDACLSQSVCYRPATGMLSNTSSGAAMLRMRTLTTKGNCTRSQTGRKQFPTDGLLESFNFVLPVGWPSAGNATWGTRVKATDLSGVFINNDNPGGDAGGIFLSRHVDQAACHSMSRLPDCSVPSLDHPGAEPTELTHPEAPTCATALKTACGVQRGAGEACMRCLEIAAHHAAIRQAGCAPPDVQEFCSAPTPPTDLRPHNTTGCYIFGGSAGRGCRGANGSIPHYQHVPCDGCGMEPATVNGHAFVSHRADGSVKVCLNQFCSRVLSGSFATASNGVGFMLMETEFAVGNCTHEHSKNFPAQGLFAHIDFIVPAGWPNSTVKSRGTSTVGARTLTGMFVNNGPHLAGTLTMNPDVDPTACDHMRELPYCATFMPS